MEIIQMKKLLSNTTVKMAAAFAVGYAVGNGYRVHVEIKKADK